MERFTQRQLEHQRQILSAILNRPAVAWRRVKGQNVASIGAIVFDIAYGGYRVAEIVSAGGGERDLFHGYRMSTRECYYCLRSAVEAVRLAIGEKRYQAGVARWNKQQGNG